MSDKTTVAGELPVIVRIHDGFELRWEGAGPIAPSIRANKIKVGDCLVSAKDATAALAQKDGEIERLQEALERAKEEFADILDWHRTERIPLRAQELAHIRQTMNGCSAALGSQA